MSQGVARFVHRHRRLLPIIGAGVVLLTFIVKDTWKEKIGATVDAIEQAERNHLMREDNERLMDFLRDIYQRVRYPHDQAQDVDLIASKDPHQVYLVVFGLQARIKQRIELLTELVGRLPHQEKNKETLGQLKPKLEALEQGLSKASDKPESDGAISSELGNVRASTSGLWHNVVSLEAAILQQAKMTKENMEYWYGVWSAISIGLFAIGWALGLLGQVFNVKASSD